MTDKLDVRDPHHGEWIMVNPDPAMCKEVMLARHADVADGAWHLVDPHFAETLDEQQKQHLQPALLFLACNQDHEFFLWPVKSPVTSEHVAYQAMDQWLCYQA